MVPLTTIPLTPAGSVTTSRVELGSYLSTSKFQELVWWSYRPAEYILNTPEHVRQMRQSQMIIGPLNAHAPSKV